MKSLSVLFFWFFIFVEVIHASGPSAPPKADPSNDEHVILPIDPHITEKKAKDEWRFWYVAKGTRSEGIHGALCVEGNWVRGKKIGETMTCLLGEFVWYGDWDDRKVTWAKSGWLPKHIAKIYPSWSIETKKAEPVRPASTANPRG